MTPMNGIKTGRYFKHETAPSPPAPFPRREPDRRVFTLLCVICYILMRFQKCVTRRDGDFPAPAESPLPEVSFVFEISKFCAKRPPFRYVSS